jgi:hypothetical protein
MTLVHLLIALVHTLYSLGAHRVYGSRDRATGNVYAVTKHVLIVACKIRAGHGTFHCSGVVSR